MFGTKTTARVRMALAAAVLCGAAGLVAVPAQAAKIGPYFPIPNGFNLNGIARDALLSIQTNWLQNGLDNLNKAHKDAEAALEKAKEGAQDQVAALEEKLKALDHQIEETKAELAVATDTNPNRETQADRKARLMLNLNQWINELNHLATEQMKIAIMSDGAEAMTAQARNYQLSEQADNLEKAKRDPSMENWGK